MMARGMMREYHVADVVLRHETEEAALVPAVHDRKP